MPSYVRLAGHGIRVLPAVPYVVRAAADGSLDVAVEDGGDAERRERIDADTPRQAHDIGEVFDGPAHEYWRLEVGGVYEATWPTELTLRSWPEPDRPPFYMLSDDAGSLIYVQGPFPRGQVPELGGLIGEGQQERGRGASGDLEWIDLAYTHKGGRWQQRHLIVPLANGATAVVTAQAKRDVAADVAAVAVRFAGSIESPR